MPAAAAAAVHAEPTSAFDPKQTSADMRRLYQGRISPIREETANVPSASGRRSHSAPMGMLFLRRDLLRIVFRVDVGEAERTCTLYLELRRALHEPVVVGLAGQEVE